MRGEVLRQGSRQPALEQFSWFYQERERLPPGLRTQHSCWVHLERPYRCHCHLYPTPSHLPRPLEMVCVRTFHTPNLVLPAGWPSALSRRFIVYSHPPSRILPGWTWFPPGGLLLRRHCGPRIQTEAALDIKGSWDRDLRPVPLPRIPGRKSHGQTPPALLQTPTAVHDYRVMATQGLSTDRLGLPSCPCKKFLANPTTQ